jgi:hypothetical protein
MNHLLWRQDAANWPCSQHICTERIQNTVPLWQCNFCVRVCWGDHAIATEPLPNNGYCFQSHYLVTAVVQLLISLSLPSNGSTSQNIMNNFVSVSHLEAIGLCVQAYLHIREGYVPEVITNAAMNSWQIYVGLSSILIIYGFLFSLNIASILPLTLLTSLMFLRDKDVWKK